MKNRRQISGAIPAICAMMIIILDTKTAITGAIEGISLCIWTVLPSLFPFFILSGIINSNLLGVSIRPLRPVIKLCKIPEGGESLLILGYLAGYPVGAQLITQEYRNGKLSEKTAHRMLGFCNNAGPAFLFGMLSPLFENPIAVWLLWGIHIISGLLVGLILPGEANNRCAINRTVPVSLPKAIQNALKVLAFVCGWVITFRIILAFFNRWFLLQFPTDLQVLLCGLLELANGCIMLGEIPLTGLRFIMASFMLSFGGLCVGMQTISATEGLGSGYYFPGKVLQAFFAVLISYCLQIFIFTSSELFLVNNYMIALFVIFLLLHVLLLRRKKL